MQVPLYRQPSNAASDEHDRTHEVDMVVLNHAEQRVPISYRRERMNICMHKAVEKNVAQRPEKSPCKYGPPCRHYDLN